MLYGDAYCTSNIFELFSKSPVNLINQLFPLKKIFLHNIFFFPAVFFSPRSQANIDQRKNQTNIQHEQTTTEYSDLIDGQLKPRES